MEEKTIGIEDTIEEMNTSVKEKKINLKIPCHKTPENSEHYEMTKLKNNRN